MYIVLLLVVCATWPPGHPGKNHISCSLQRIKKIRLRVTLHNISIVVPQFLLKYLQLKATTLMRFVSIKLNGSSQGTWEWKERMIGDSRHWSEEDICLSPTCCAATVVTFQILPQGALLEKWDHSSTPSCHPQCQCLSHQTLKIFFLLFFLSQYPHPALPTPSQQRVIRLASSLRHAGNQPPRFHLAP